ncbi:TetR family transcriptional regulator [Ilumatobacter fluminis]|uniref:TetR family transcriptional regulator n=1 Tax=Ilumatobacter fluminis TaxID=467091 RepID=A0A4R7I116_9ACTN|nr:TetR/AcrR family transcriptional regulator [Ilumatobacter fluminis]TDT17151.1 TetR family transcriptional regulator [Ilumatobacter fluminis]
MPKITAPTIAEHVEVREREIMDAAMRLFAERGVRDVSIGDIADDVGLARTSLYRYFRTKSAIIHAWFDATMGPIIDECTAIADDVQPAAQRLERWLDVQLDVLSDPSNHAMIAAALEADDMTDRRQGAIAIQHQALYATLEQILADDRPVDDNVRARTIVISGLLRTLTDLVQHGIPPTAAREQIRVAINAIEPVADGEPRLAAAPNATGRS